MININDEVYVFKNKLLNNKYDIINIDSNMYGKIINIEQWEEDDGWLTQDFKCFKFTIQLNNGNKICIKDIFKQCIKRYTFLTKSDLNILMADNKLNNYSQKYIKRYIEDINISYLSQ
ncbi:hypothetical protein [Clostridium butyricum]|uniref:Uncharacterized protein n=1 Tax=Clostridium butyricum TaxID=1492 RepID=A0A6N3FNS3_CLOBU